MTLRIGTLGTVAGDAAITGMTAEIILEAAGLSALLTFDVKLLTATSAQKLGAAGTVYGGASTSAQAAATVISSASANSLYVSLAIASSAGDDTVGITSGQIQLITP